MSSINLKKYELFRIIGTIQNELKQGKVSSLFQANLSRCELDTGTDFIILQ